MRYAILGSVELSAGERRVAVEGRRQPGLLVFLLLHANKAVSADQLIDALWSDQPAEGARKRLRMAIVRMRQVLEVCEAGREPALRTVGGGYVLDVAPGELDSDAFAARAEDGRRALEEGDASRATGILRDALGLWRGPALADVAYEDWAQPEIRRLEELRLAAHESRIDADLQLGRHAAMIGELDGLVARHPTRERFVEQLIVALYRCGRQTDALDVYHRTRARLAAELGLEPGPRLRALQTQVLAQSPSLELVAPAPARPVTLRTSRSAPIGVPARPGAVFGRESDTHAVLAMLRRDEVRLVTVMGTGGVGKTTLAIEVAHRLADEFADGAVFVDLSALADPGALADAMLHALGWTAGPGASATETLCRLVSASEQLLVVDNLEHLVFAAPLLADVLNAAPRLKVLATSRAALDLRAERRYRLDPLELPASSDLTTVAAAPATALFIDRVVARDPAFELTTQSAGAIATVCSRVGGLPLAIELAAAHASTLSPQEIALRLDGALATLGSGARDVPDRQRTLRATLDWSYRLLDEAQRDAFAKLGVFAGGCTIDAAEHVIEAGLEILESLIDHSMLTRRVAADGTTRLVLLEPLREYAAERLHASATAAAVCDRHSRYFIDRAEHIAPRLVAADQLVWQRRLDADADNLHEVLEREYRAGNAERVLRLATALQDWWKRGRGSAGREWIEKGLAIASDPPPELHARALTTLALLSVQRGDVADARSNARQALELYGDRSDRGKTVALVAIAVCHLVLSDLPGASAAAAAAVRSARDLGGWPLGYALVAQALAAPDPAAATPIADRAARLLEQAGDTRAQAFLFGDLGYRALEYGALDRARDLIGRSLRLSDQLDDEVHHTFDIGHMALWALEAGDDAAAAAGLSEALTRCSRYGIRRPIPEALIGLATIAANAGHADRAAELVGAATTLRAEDPPTGIERRLHSRASRRSRREAETHAWERAYAKGCRRSIEQAVELGLETASQCDGTGRTRPAASVGEGPAAGR